MEVHFVPEKTRHQTPYLWVRSTFSYVLFTAMVRYLKLVEHSITEEQEAHRADETKTSGEGDQEVREKPVLGYHGDARNPGSDVILRVHIRVELASNVVWTNLWQWG